MKMKLALLLLAGAAFPMAAAAQTCTSPLPMFGGSTYNADTSTASDIIAGVGPAQSTGPDIVYSFVADGVSPTSTIDVTSPSFDWAIWLTTDCSVTIGSGDVISGKAGVAGTGDSMTLSNSGTALVDGTTYYVILTSSPADNNGQSGTMTVETPTPLPVELQNFSAK